jgi:hypothetical protein
MGDQLLVAPVAFSCPAFLSYEEWTMLKYSYLNFMMYLSSLSMAVMQSVQPITLVVSMNSVVCFLHLQHWFTFCCLIRYIQLDDILSLTEARTHMKWIIQVSTAFCSICDLVRTSTVDTLCTRK